MTTTQASIRLNKCKQINFNQLMCFYLQYDDKYIAIYGGGTSRAGFWMKKLFGFKVKPVDLKISVIKLSCSLH